MYRHHRRRKKIQTSPNGGFHAHHHPLEKDHVGLRHQQMSTGLQTMGKGMTMIPGQHQDLGRVGAGLQAKAKGTIIAMLSLNMANVHMDRCASMHSRAQPLTGHHR